MDTKTLEIPDTAERLWDMADRKISNLIEIALNDLEAHEASSCFRIDMGYWHNLVAYDVFNQELQQDTTERICTVCFAGSTMYRGGIGPERDQPDPDHKDWPAWYALNHLRLGQVSYAAKDLGLNPDKFTKFNRNVSNYADNPRVFKSQMREIIEDLRSKGK